MSNFNDEFCEYNYSTPVTENFVNSDTNKLNNEKIIHNRQVAVQYGQLGYLRLRVSSPR